MVKSLGYWIEHLSEARFICLGDVMLDRFVWGDVDRICPEAPVPVIRVRKEEEMLGGAGNVLRNLDALGARGAFFCAIGDDAAGRHLKTLTDRLRHTKSHFITLQGSPTTEKVRYISSGQQLLRADTEDCQALEAVHEAQFLNPFEQLLPEQNVVVLSDYDKGVLTPTLTQALIAHANGAQKMIIADPKGRDFSKYANVNVLTPNTSELAFATGLPVNTDKEVEIAARSIMASFNIQALVVTRSAEGMSVVTAKDASHIPTMAREVFDVSGAGDTVVSTLAAALAIGAPLVDAARLANVAAGIVVAKVGTAVVSQAELLEEIHHQAIQSSESSIVSAHQAAAICSTWQKTGQSVAFTNGCFDLLHPGHLSLLQQARAAGQKLVVGLNSDASTKRLKGKSRPIQPELARALVLSALEQVDLVVIFEEDTPLQLIETLRPDVLVKGADYTLDTVVGADVVQSYGGRVILAELENGHSTTSTVEKMAKSA